MCITQNPDDLYSAFVTLSSMNVGLMIAAIVSAAQNQLSFFSALQVQNLVW